MPNITIQEVTLETVTKGRNSYNVATGVHTTDRGDNKTKKIMSFANPAVFAAIKDAKQGDVFAVTYTPGDQYYNWATATKASADAPAKATMASGGKVVGSTYETPDERKIKQLYIVKQSSIANAIELLSVGAKTPPKVSEVLETAQQFVDFVYGTNENLETMGRDDSAIPQD